MCLKYEALNQEHTGIVAELDEIKMRFEMSNRKSMEMNKENEVIKEKLMQN